MSYGGKAAERLSGKTILITGASAGIGEATAREFAAAANGNVKLVLTARRKEKLDSLAESLKLEYSNIKVLPVTLDVPDVLSIEPVVNGLPTEFADLDVLINNAGLALGRDEVGSIDAKDIATMFNTNVLGLITLTQAVLRIYKAKNSGDIVNLGSEPLLAEDIAEIIVFGVTRKQKTVIAETLVFSTNQASASHLYREQS